MVQPTSKRLVTEARADAVTAAEINRADSSTKAALSATYLDKASGLSKAEAATGYAAKNRAQRRPVSLASLSDSIGMNGAFGMSVTTLAAPVAAGATTITINNPELDGSGANVSVSGDFAVDTLIRIGTEYAVILTAATGANPGPYTITLATGLASAHPAGDRVMSTMNLFAGTPSASMGASILSGGWLKYAGNYGHGGYTVDQLQRLYLPKVIEAKPGYCYVMGGRNRGTDTAAQSANRTVAIWDELLENGIIPVGSTIPPVNAQTTQQRSDDERFNAIITRAAAQRGIPFDDFHAKVVDPVTGDYATGMQTGGDLVHPSEAGRRIQSQGIIDAINRQNPNKILPQPSKNLHKDALIRPLIAGRDNALMLTTGGTTTGTGSTSIVPLNWIASIPGANGQSTTITAPTGNGKAIKVERYAGAQSGANTVTTETQGDATLIAGHRYQLSAAIKTAGIAAAQAANPGFGGWRIVAAQMIPGGTRTFFDMFTVTQDYEGAISTDFVVAPGAPTTFRLGIRLAGTASTPAYSLTLWNVQLIDLTELGIASESPWPYQGVA